ncbi:DNA double-strand break repair nuclease NurA [Candidatus Woesearchaeota archaeon]|nr:MAG: DNA double-strand break repair nuclease NurA [Candidatus Woesearchaeota archaeon]
MAKSEEESKERNGPEGRSAPAERVVEILKQMKSDREDINSISIAKDGEIHILKPESLRQFEDTDSKDVKWREAIFIDGGQAALIENSDFCLSFIRIGAFRQSRNNDAEKNETQGPEAQKGLGSAEMAMRDQKRKGKQGRAKVSEFYIAVKAESEDTPEKNEKTGLPGFKSEIVSIKDEIGLEEFLKHIEQATIAGTDASNRRREAPEAAALIRRILEICAARALLHEESSRDTILVLDGHLEWEDNQERKFLAELLKEADEKETAVAALAKKTGMTSEDGKSVVSLLKVLEKKTDITGNWIAALEGSSSEKENARNDNDNRKEARVKTYFVKLHPKSRFVFKLQIPAENSESADLIAGWLSRVSKDPVFLGYPYGLIMADRIARVSNREAEYEKTRLKAKLGREWRDVEDALAMPDAHSVLDSIY